MMLGSPTPEARFGAFFRKNFLFFFLFLVFWIPALITLFYIEHGDVVRWVNANRTSFADFFFSNGTHLGEEIAYLSLIIILLFIRYRSAIMVPLIGISVFLISLCLKFSFGFPRPAVYFKFQGNFEYLNPLENIVLNEGWNSFPSGHTMSGFALYSFIAFNSKHKYILGPFLFVLALIVGFSRIYLMQHFLQDVVFGSILGIGVGMIFYALQYRLFPNPHPWADHSLLKHNKYVVSTNTEELTEEI